MHRRNERMKPRQTAIRHTPRRWAATTGGADPEPASFEVPSGHGADQSSPPTADAALEFGRCRVLLRRRQLVADGVPVEIGTRAFDLLVVLLEADGSLVSKEELLSRAWPGIVVSEENLKVQISALRKALGADRDVIHTEFGRGYRFTGMLRSSAAAEAGQPPAHRNPRSRRIVFPINFRQSSRCSFSST